MPEFKSNITSGIWASCLSALILISLNGCGNFERGGGSRGVVSGGSTFETVFGCGEGQKLEFVVFTDITSEGTVSSGGSTWTGKISSKTGTAVDYEGNSSGLTLNGTHYNFTDGKVFLVSTQQSNVSVTQLKLQIEESTYAKEIDRLAKTEEVKQFFSN